MLGNNQDRQHLSNKIGRDAANAILKEFHDNFPEGVIPYVVEDTWTELIYNAIGNVAGNKLTMRLVFNTYKKIDVCRTEDTYWKTGYQSHIFVFEFKNSDLVSEMYNKIKKELSAQLRGNKLYLPHKRGTTKVPAEKKKSIYSVPEKVLLLL
jgi:hypothetical protein